MDYTFSLPSGLCAVFAQGGCKARFCAVEYLSRPLERTALWVAMTLARPLVGDCVLHGKEGVAGDSSVLNGDGGSYRLWIGRALH